MKPREVTVEVPPGADSYQTLSDELARHGGSWEVDQALVGPNGERRYLCRELLFRQDLDPVTVVHDEG